MPDSVTGSRRILAGAKGIAEMIETMAQTLRAGLRRHSPAMFVGVGPRGLALAERLRGKVVPEAPPAVPFETSPETEAKGEYSGLSGHAVVLVCDVLAVDQALPQQPEELRDQIRLVAALVLCRSGPIVCEPDVVGTQIETEAGQHVEVNLWETDPKERVLLVTR
jgi:pyrimidine operon attenuation protein/uracil phosphoribosyltransferase